MDPAALAVFVTVAWGVRNDILRYGVGKDIYAGNGGAGCAPGRTIRGSAPR